MLVFHLKTFVNAPFATISLPWSSLPKIEPYPVNTPLASDFTSDSKTIFFISESH